MDRTNNEKSIENPGKRGHNRPKIDKKSILGRFGRPKPFRGRVRTRPGPLLDAKMAPKSLSGDAPGGPRAAKSRRKESPGRLKDVPRASGTAPKTLVSPVRVAKRSEKRWQIDFECFWLTHGHSKV